MAHKSEPAPKLDEGGELRSFLSRVRNVRCFRLLSHWFYLTIVLVTSCTSFSLYLYRRLPQIERNEQLVWLTPRSGGFNNQLITVYEAVNCARMHNRKVVLPLMYENVRYDTSFKGSGPYPFEDYFDVSAMKQIVPVTTPAELDRIGLPCSTIYFSNSRHSDANKRRIPRLLKQQYAKRYNVQVKYLPSFSYPLEHNCVDDSMCRAEDHALLGKYSSYEVTGQGYDIRNSSVFKEVRAAFQPSSTVRAISQLVLDSIEGPFNAVHLRRGDYALKCTQMPALCERFGQQAMVQSRETILSRVNDLDDPTLPLFVTSTHPAQCRELLNDSGLEVFFLADFDLPRRLRWAKKRVDILAFADRIIASKAEQFIGNRFSSFSAEINYYRYLRNSSDELVFF